jgi:Transposase DDE domain
VNAVGAGFLWHARRRRRTPSCWCCAIEGTIAQSACVTGIRRARHHGLAKTRLEHLAAATAINVIRLDAWYTGNPIDRGKTTCLQRISLPPAPN